MEQEVRGPPVANGRGIVQVKRSSAEAWPLATSPCPFVSSAIWDGGRALKTVAHCRCLDGDVPLRGRVSYAQPLLLQCESRPPDLRPLGAPGSHSESPSLQRAEPPPPASSSNTSSGHYQSSPPNSPHRLCSQAASFEYRESTKIDGGDWAQLTDQVLDTQMLDGFGPAPGPGPGPGPGTGGHCQFSGPAQPPTASGPSGSALQLLIRASHASGLVPKALTVLSLVTEEESGDGALAFEQRICAALAQISPSQTALGHLLEADEGGLSLLHYLSFLGCSAALATLLPALPPGDWVNRPDAAGWAPLHYAALRDGGADAIALLLAHGADLDLETEQGLSPFDLACHLNTPNQVHPCARPLNSHPPPRGEGNDAPGPGPDLSTTTALAPEETWSWAP